MNYRHAFHAGNFADLVKHAALLALLDRLQHPVSILDTHSGRGLYDLSGAEAERSGEARAGIARLMAADDLPAPMAALRGAVQRLNGGGEARLYPGSPLLIAGKLRKGDAYLACELRPEEQVELARTLAPFPGAASLCADGFDQAAKIPATGDALVLIDPPFERGDDYGRVATALGRIAKRNPAAVTLVWLPLKDLETFDSFLRKAQDAGAGPLLVAEARMRPLTDPMKMNGCALVLARPPADFAPVLQTICEWTTGALGSGGSAKVWTDA